MLYVSSERHVKKVRGPGSANAFSQPKINIWLCELCRNTLKGDRHFCCKECSSVFCGDCEHGHRAQCQVCKKKHTLFRVILDFVEEEDTVSFADFPCTKSF